MRILILALFILASCKPGTQASEVADARPEKVKVVSNDLTATVNVNEINVGSLSDSFDSSVELYFRLFICDGDKKCEKIELSDGYFYEFHGFYSGEKSDHYSSKVVVVDIKKPFKPSLSFETNGILINEAAKKLKIKDSTQATFKIALYESDSWGSELISEQKFSQEDFFSESIKSLSEKTYQSSFQFSVTKAMDL